MNRCRPAPPVTLLAACLLAASLLLLGGCSSIKALETWRSATPPASPYQKPLIVAIGHDENVRAEVENIMVVELGRAGVTAVASHSCVKEIDRATRDDIVAAVRATGADAVLTIKPGARGDMKVTQGGTNQGIYGTATNFGGTLLAGARTYERALFTVTLYDRASTELVWSATFKTYDADNPGRISRALSSYLLKKLRTDGFL